MPTKSWFPHYTESFKTVELNAPFYSWPTLATVKSWRRQAPAEFIYTVKVCELITHTKQFKNTKRLIADFGFIADLLGPMMGCFLFQLPPKFHYTPARLKNIVSQLDHRRRNVVEFRHESWWDPAVFDAFRQTDTIFSSCSAPKVPDQLVKTADEVYIRFHGTSTWYRHNYSDDELAMWAERIRTSGASRVWAYFNNDQQAYATQNAKTFTQLMRKKAGTK